MPLVRIPTRYLPFATFVTVTLSLLTVGGITAWSQTRPTSRPVRRASTRPAMTEAALLALAEQLRAAYAKPATDWPAATLDPGVTADELGTPGKAPFPADNPYTKPKALLGERLFFDRRLSGSGQIACASCHDPDLGWADGRTVSFGHDRQAGRRNAPSVRGAAYHKTLFWDGRAPSLEAQASHPITTDIEMHADPDVVVKRLTAVPEYRQAFADAFGADVTIDMHHVGMAIATFERALPVGRTKFDAFLAGRTTALSDSAVRGLHLFRTTARCLNCHNGPMLSDEQFHNVGLSYYGRKLQDLGRYEITKNPADVGAFRTPGLRDVTRTGPYMHNGIFELEGVMNLYNAGMPTLRRKPEQANDPLFPTKDKLLKSLDLSPQQIDDLMAFLDSLAEPKLRIRPPEPWPDPAPATRP